MNEKRMCGWWKQCLLLLLIMAGLCGCTSSEQVEPESTEPPTVTVRFFANNDIVSEQTIVEGERPAAVSTVALPGWTFSGWLDDSGALITPELISVSQDTDYTALLYPALSNHVPYLFADLDGNIRPDDFLTVDELGMALQMLAAEDTTGGYLTNTPAA